VQIHYYEDGNVQLNSSKQVTEKISLGDNGAAAKQLFKVVLEAENAYQVRV
jgi:capping protein alpha